MEPYIYSLIAKDRLQEMLSSFQALTGLPVQVIDENGNVILSEGELTSFCREFRKHLPENDSCEKLHAGAGKKAIELGETYIFQCHACLNHIVFPLINRNAFFGSVLVGPFLMDKPGSTMLLDIAKRYRLDTPTILDLYDRSESVKIVTPALVTHISRLLYYLLCNLITDSREQFITNQNKLLQQSRINESIQKYKMDEQTDAAHYPYEKEKMLISKVKIGDHQAARAILNDLLGYVLFSGGNDLDNIKARSVELCSLLSRAAIEGGAPTDAILVLNNKFLKSLTEITNFDDLCYKLQEIVEVFTDSLFHQASGKNNEAVRRAISYMADNYPSPVTLEDVAAYVHLNPSYFSTLFRQATGSTFKDHLNMVRIEESKHLLANTDYSVIDIAIACGFEDQSYFSKVFKKYTGLTPKQYR